MYDKQRTGALAEGRILGLAQKSEIIVQAVMAKPSAQQLIELGISRGHAYDILAERQEPSLAKAFLIYDATGAQFGILKGLSKETIEALRPKAAA